MCYFTFCCSRRYTAPWESRVRQLIEELLVKHGPTFANIGLEVEYKSIAVAKGSSYYAPAIVFRTTHSPSRSKNMPMATLLQAPTPPSMLGVGVEKDGIAAETSC